MNPIRMDHLPPRGGGTGAYNLSLQPAFRQLAAAAQQTGEVGGDLHADDRRKRDLDLLSLPLRECWIAAAQANLPFRLGEAGVGDGRVGMAPLILREAHLQVPLRSGETTNEYRHPATSTDFRDK
jgi:hypothetical protein